ncbi:MAG: hypothetical protein ACLVJ6_13100 [Merdibacter sp.]
MMTVRPKHMKHRDVMILEGILRMHPDGSPVKMSDISEYFKVTRQPYHRWYASLRRRDGSNG